MINVPVIGGVVKEIIDALRSVGIIKTAEDELRAQERLAAVVAQQWQNITDFVRATTPDPNRVYVWANTLIAVIRPLVTVALVVDIIMNPTNAINLNDARMYPILWWFFGPEVAKFVGGFKPAGGLLRSNSAHLEEVTKENGGAPFTSGTGFKKERANEK